MNKPRIMLVDDEEFVITSLKRSLRREGYEIVSFNGAEKALEYLKEINVDIVVSDHQMPSLTGIEFLIQVRKIQPKTIRILLTGYADTDVAIRAINEGKLYRFLTKPWDEEELKTTLANAVRLGGILNRNQDQLEKIKKEEGHINVLEKKHPGISHVKKTKDGAIIIEESDIGELSNINLRNGPE